MTGPLDLYLFLAQSPFLLCLTVAITSIVVAVKS